MHECRYVRPRHGCRLSGTALPCRNVHPLYSIKTEPVFESTFHLRLDDEHRAAVAAAAAADAASAAEAQAAARTEELAESHRSDSPDRRLVHAWVLVKAGQREVDKDTFVEVTSGRTYSPADCPYHGIEFAWNHENFWVCMGMPAPHSDSRLHPVLAHFNWQDPAMWEAVLPTPQPPPPPLAAEAASTTEHGEAGEAAAGTTGLSVAAGSVAASALDGMASGTRTGTGGLASTRGTGQKAADGDELVDGDAGAAWQPLSMQRFFLLFF